MLQDARFRIQEEDADYGMQYDTRYRIQNTPETMLDTFTRWKYIDTR